jgi:hypothetical protein
MMMTCACRMQSYVCKQLGKDIIYLSPRLANLQGMERVNAWILMQGKIKYTKGQYVLQAMKKIQENGCILAAHRFG